jgi:hypothetical protein
MPTIPITQQRVALQQFCGIAESLANLQPLGLLIAQAGSQRADKHLPKEHQMYCNAIIKVVTALQELQEITDIIQSEEAANA